MSPTKGEGSLIGFSVQILLLSKSYFFSICCIAVTFFLNFADLFCHVCCCFGILTHFILETPKGVLAKSADPDQMPHNVASDLGLHYFASCSTIFQQKYLN